MTDTTTLGTTYVHRVYIKAPADAIWRALTDPTWTVRYGYGGHVQYDLRPGGRLRVTADEAFRATAEAQGHVLPDEIIEGEVVEVEPPRRLSTTWRMLMDETVASEPLTTITYEIDEHEGGYCSLTVVHDCAGAPVHLTLVSGQGETQGAGGGHAWVLSDLKSLLETGTAMTR